MLIKNEEDFKQQLLKSLQTNFTCKGMTYSEFEKSLKETGDYDINNYLKFTPYRSLKNAIKGFFSHIISFSGDDMSLISVEALADGNPDLIPIYSLQLRTEDKGKGKKKSRSSGRFQPVSNQTVVRKLSTSSNRVPSPVFEQYAAYGDEYDDHHRLRYEYEDDLPYTTHPSSDSHNASFYEEEYAPPLSSAHPGSESERLLLEFRETCNDPPRNLSSEIVSEGIRLAEEVFHYADQIRTKNAEDYMIMKPFYDLDSLYFNNVIMDIYRLLQDDRIPEPFHDVLMRLDRALYPKPGFDYLDVYNLINAIGEEFFICSGSIEDCMPIFIIESKKSSSEEDLDRRIDELITELPLNIQNGLYVLKVCTSPNYNLPYYVLFPTDDIDKILRNVENLKPVKQVYPKLLCLVKVRDALHRAVVITSEDFEDKGIQVELVDVGAVIRKPADELYEVEHENALNHPRMAIPAVINMNSLEPNLPGTDDFYKRYISIDNIPLAIQVQDTHVTFEVIH